MANVFNSVKGLHPKLNSFSAHTYRNDLTSQLGVNIPIFQQHVLPGSFVKVSTSALVRLQALIAPVMDNIDFYVHFWKIPYRLLEGDRFTQFISGEIEQADYEGLFLTPEEFLNTLLNTSISYNGFDKGVTDFQAIIDNGQLLDYLGYDKTLFHYENIEPVPGEESVYQVSKANNTTKLNFRPLIAYYFIHLNWYMNENVPYAQYFQTNVENLINNETASESMCYLLVDSYEDFGTTLLPHGWDKDYFTSALPNVQFGSPVQISLAGTASVSIPEQPFDIHPIDELATVLRFQLDNASDPEEPEDNNVLMHIVPEGEETFLHDNLGNFIHGVKGGNSPMNGTADLTNVSVITINELRFANALQVFKERQMRYGRRRQEYYKGFFNVSPEDLRLQLPKYLGGGRIPINIADIEQTSKTDGSSALGHLAGKATAVAGGFAGFKTYCSEESIIIGIGFAIPHITYANSISKFLLKTNDIYDYFNPSFEHLGEQEIKKIEIYGGATDPDGAFGYTPRYNEYRFHSNEMHGEFKNTLAYWTLGRVFSSTPGLNKKFIYMQPSVFDRIFAVSGQPSMLCSFLFRQRIVQPVSKYGTPMLLS